MHNVPNVPSCHELVGNETAIYIENLNGNTLVMTFFWNGPTDGMDFIPLTLVILNLT